MINIPGKDGTGPMGLGQMSVKGLGLCSGLDKPRCGSGFGRSRGFKAGIGKHFAFSTNADSEKDFLSQQKTLLQSRIDYIKQKLEQL